MTVVTKICGEDGCTVLNKAVQNKDPSEFLFEFQCLPCLGDRVLIQDGPAKGTYVVEQPIVHEITGDKAYPIMLLKWESLPNGIIIAIDN